MEKHKCMGHRTVIWGVDASKRVALTICRICVAVMPNQSHNLVLSCTMLFEQMHILSPDKAP